MSQLSLRPFDVAPRVDRFVTVAGAPIDVTVVVIVDVTVDVTVGLTVGITVGVTRDVAVEVSGDVTVDSTVDDAAFSGLSAEGVRLLKRATARK